MGYEERDRRIPWGGDWRVLEACYLGLLSNARTGKILLVKNALCLAHPAGTYSASCGSLFL